MIALDCVNRQIWCYAKYYAYGTFHINYKVQNFVKCEVKDNVGMNKVTNQLYFIYNFAR